MKKYIILLLIIPILIISSCSFKELFCKHEYEKTNEIAATCENYGKIVYECNKCGHIKEDVILKTDHHYNDWHTTQEATCLKEGISQRECTICGHKEAKSISKLEHDFHEKEITPATCTEGEITVFKCDNCGTLKNETTSNPLGHDFGEYSVKVEATEFTDGELERTCSRCGYVEKTIVPANNYIDYEVVKYNYRGQDIVYEVDTLEEMATLFNVAVLNQATTLKVYAKFNTDNLLDYLKEHYTIGIAYSVKMSMLLKDLTFTLSYNNPYPTIKSEEIFYKQYASANVQDFTSTRSADYDDFKINKSPLEYNDVRNSFQLFYVLERFVKPNCVPGSIAETLYNKCKEILRNIVDDSMTDTEKALAIYNYVIMNTTYDKELYSNESAIYNGSPYRGFHLEGVFEDNLAVCEGISQAVCCLCNIEGIRCVQTIGHMTDRLGNVGHAWNKVFVDSNWYVLDATSGGTIVNEKKEVLTDTFFLISNDTFKSYYTEDNFTNIVCFNDYDLFSNLYYEVDDEKYSFSIKSQLDLNRIVKYFYNNYEKESTIEFRIDFDYGTTFMDELDIAYKLMGHLGGIQYINHDNIVLLMKE